MRFTIRSIVLCAVALLAGCAAKNPAVESVKAEPGLSEEQIKRLINDAVAKATKEISENLTRTLEAEKQKRDAELRDALARRDAVAKEYERLQQQAKAAGREADDSQRRYEDDIRRAATLAPEEQMRLREIARKRNTGEGLTARELEFASQFNEFREFVEQEGARRAREFGLSDVFGGSKQKPAAGKAKP